jgi:branched-chain amino acid transport system ATP-binding protein
MSQLLELVDLRVAYGEVQVVDGLTMSVGVSGVTALLGANGAGKTTILRAISNIMVRTRGDIRFRGHSLAGMSPQSIARLGISHVPDGRGTFLHLTVEENLRLGAYTRNDKGAISSDMQRVFDYFPRLRERLWQTAGTLSGGEQQMLAIGRALMSRPALLLLDEPSFGLAPRVVKEIFQILKTIRQQHQASILLVEQNASLALELADHAYLLETGKVVLEGSGAQLAADESIRRTYLGY